MSSKLSSLTNTNFGVEIEIGEDYDEDWEYERPDWLLPDWSIKEEHCGTELISPVLSGYEGLIIVRAQMKKLYESFDIMSFDDCGLHVHVDIQNFTLGNLKKLLLIGSRFDDVIFSLMRPERRDNQFCAHSHYTESEIRECRSMRDIYALQGSDPVEGRYVGLNTWAWKRHGTVEFRYAAGCTDWRLIYAYVTMYMRMVSFAKTADPIPVWQHGDLKTGLATFCSMLNIASKVKEILVAQQDKYWSGKIKPYSENYKNTRDNFPMTLGTK